VFLYVIVFVYCISMTLSWFVLEYVWLVEVNTGVLACTTMDTLEVILFEYNVDSNLVQYLLQTNIQ
jgi:hypothetical protein